MSFTALLRNLPSGWTQQRLGSFFPISQCSALFLAYSKHFINAACIQGAAEQDMEAACYRALCGLPTWPYSFRQACEGLASAVALAFCRLLQSSSRAALSSGD